MTTEQQVHHHPEGVIFVRAVNGEYSDTLENVRRDSGVDVPDLPEGATERLYVVGKRHAVIAGPDVIAGGPVPWDIGDALIAQVGELLSAQQARQPPPPPEPQASEQSAPALQSIIRRMAEIEARLDQLERSK